MQDDLLLRTLAPLRSRLGAPLPPVVSRDYSTYITNLTKTFWAYRTSAFGDSDALFDALFPADGELPRRPPVFCPEAAEWNVLTDDTATGAISRASVEALIPSCRRHRWFGSMKSSQALAQSVFGNLYVLGKLHLLERLTTEDGVPLFPPASKCHLEWSVGPFADDTKGARRNPLGEQEGRGTSIDVFLIERGSDYRVAVECKLAEAGIGVCSKASGESDPCHLTAKGLMYGKLSEKLFSWKDGRVCGECQIKDTYQLVRNVLSACLSESEGVDPTCGHTVLVYDSRNPAFQVGGAGMVAWEATYGALIYPHLLQRCSWQDIATCLQYDDTLRWLVKGLWEKYGIAPA